MKNLKKSVCAICAAAMLTAPVCGAAKTIEFTMGSTDFYVSDDGIEKLQLEAAPYTDNDRTMVPVRVVSENFGADVDWVEETSTVIIQSGDKKLELTIGSSDAYVNGELKVLDAAACEINGRTMVPLRFISEELGKNVEYVETSEQIIISDEKPIMTVNGKAFTMDDFKFAAAMNGYGADAATWKAYTEQQPEMMKEIVEGLMGMLKEAAILSDEAKNTGLMPENKNELESLVAQLLEVADRAVYPTALVAPGVKLYENIMNAQALTDSFIDKEYTDEELKSYYEENYIRAKHILIAKNGENNAEARDKAATVLKSVNTGADFDKLMEKYNEDPGMKTQPDGYIFAHGEMVEEFEKAAFELKEGKTGGIVETDFGYHIIKREGLPEYDDSKREMVAAAMTEAEFKAFYAEKTKKANIKTYMTSEEILEAMGK